MQTIDQLRKNMILGLEKDANFKFEKDWEFFTNMFKKQVADNFSSMKADSWRIFFLRPSTGQLQRSWSI